MSNANSGFLSDKPGEIRPMTGVRGIAALAVVALHFFDSVGAVARPWQHAYLAVDLFFMLSGLVLALNYASTVTLSAGHERYVGFVKKRIARVYPLYIAVTLLQTAYDLLKHYTRGLPMPLTWELKTMVANLFLVQSWGFSKSVVVPAWSLSAELGAYFLFPVLVALTVRRKTAITWGAAVLSMALLFTASVWRGDCGAACNGFFDLIEGDTPYPLMRCVAGFTLGLVAYRLTQLPRIRAMISTDLFAILSFAATIAAYCAGYHDSVIYLLLFATVIACFGNSRAANVVFGNRVVFFIGEISFSIYLVHMLLSPAIRRVEAFSAAHFGGLSGIMSASILFLAVLALATASYHLIELPGKRFMLALMSRKKTEEVARAPVLGEGINGV